ncbi:MAG: phosphoribosyltransferase [Verrucomicrobia bacterium]|nr:phosphoribosyltransferase [Verrucomicrobiota bacterium]MDE3099858.1 phosphoribosyltransferase [Verrucomicrobiota bacterium]
MIYASRQDAGRRLGKFLRKRRVSADIVLGLPRGGVIVAAEIARELKLPLNVLVVRKIGHPLQREFAVGAIAGQDAIFLNQETLANFPVPPDALDKVIAEEKDRLADYERRFHCSGRPDLAGKTVLLADDGLATGATAEAAVASVRKRHARQIIVTAPVASTGAVERLERVANAVIVPHVDARFQAVGEYYTRFSQTTDDEVLALLRENR